MYLIVTPSGLKLHVWLPDLDKDQERGIYNTTTVTKTYTSITQTYTIDINDRYHINQLYLNH